MNTLALYSIASDYAGASEFWLDRSLRDSCFTVIYAAYVEILHGFIEEAFGG